MKYSKVTIKNINKKIIAGALTITFLTTGLTGCSGKFNYSTDKQGIYEVSGTIEYDVLKNCCFLVIENPDYDAIEYYIAYDIDHASRYSPTYHSYDNVFNNQEVFNDKTAEGARYILSCDKLENYLYASGNIKASYTKEDVEQILEELKKNCLKENNKQLVKE